MFVDASAIVAIIPLELDHQSLAARLDEADDAFTSAIAVYEAVLAITRKRQVGVGEAQTIVEEFLRRAAIRVASIEPGIATAALDAFSRYGKGRGDPARLNLADCFAYAMAKQHGAPLLYNGSDFSRTDLA